MSHDLRTPCCQSGSPPGIALHQALLVFPKRVLPIFSSRHYVKRGDNVTPVHAIIQTLFSTSLRNKCTYRYSTSCLYFIDCLKNNKTLELSDLSVFTLHPWQFFFFFPLPLQWFNFSRVPSRTSPGAGYTACVPSRMWEPWCPVTLPYSMSTTPHRSVQSPFNVQEICISW